MMNENQTEPIKEWAMVNLCHDCMSRFLDFTEPNQTHTGSEQDDSTGSAPSGELKTLKDLHKAHLKTTSPAIEVVSIKTLRQEAIKWVKLIRSMKYGQRLCLNCMKVYGGGNCGHQYCCGGIDDGELHFLEQQTGSSRGAVEILMKTNNIKEWVINVEEIKKRAGGKLI